MLANWNSYSKSETAHQSAQQRIADFIDEMRQQRVETAHLDVGNILQAFTRQSDALPVGWNPGPCPDSAATPSTSFRTAARRDAQIDVPIGDGVEGAGVDCDAWIGAGHAGTGSAPVWAFSVSAGE